jgi:hypothetical protein
MKKFIQLKITVTILLLFFTFISRGQISHSREEVIIQYGFDFYEGIYEGYPYLLYTNPVSTKTSGFFIQQKVMFFRETNDGNSYCYKFQLLEPGSELKINIDIFNRDIEQVGFQHWVDPADGINYRIEQPEGFCLITAWLENGKPEIHETSFF